MGIMREPGETDIVSPVEVADHGEQNEYFLDENDPPRRRIGDDLGVGDCGYGSDSDVTRCERRKYLSLDTRREAAAKRNVRV